MGNKQSQFEALIIPHAASLLRFAKRLCGNHQVAEDLVQEALLRAWRGVNTLRDTSNPRAWVFRILLNTCVQRRPAAECPSGGDRDE